MSADAVSDPSPDHLDVTAQIDTGSGLDLDLPRHINLGDPRCPLHPEGCQVDDAWLQREAA